MKSPYKRIIVYDLETGGFNENFNPITEIAMVAIDLESLEIIDQMSNVILPYIDLTYMEEDYKKESKILFNLLKKKEDDRIFMGLRGEDITIRNLEPLEEEIGLFMAYLKSVHNEMIFDYPVWKKFLESDRWGDISKIYFDKCYTPQAFEVTHMDTNILLKEGMPKSLVAENAYAFLSKHTVGNSRPILSGHNIKVFDNRFFEKLLIENKRSLYKSINESVMIDTIEWARLLWFETSSYSLGSCANELGLTHKEAHRALPDTIANAQVLIKMLKSLRGEGLQKSEYKRRKFNFNI